MTRNTDELIRRLARSAAPVQPLQGPWLRAARWLALSLPCIAIVVVAASPRRDLVSKLADWHFFTEELAAVTTGLCAAAAAFATVIPGYDRRFLLLPVLPLTLWLGSLGQGCAQDWMQLGWMGVSFQPSWVCLPSIAVVGAVPAIVMVRMLRRGAPLTPRLTMALGGLAAAGLGNFGLRLFHVVDASLMVLVWQFGAVCVLSAVSGVAGGYLLSWKALGGGRRAAQGLV